MTDQKKSHTLISIGLMRFLLNLAPLFTKSHINNSQQSVLTAQRPHISQQLNKASTQASLTKQEPFGTGSKIF